MLPSTVGGFAKGSAWAEIGRGSAIPLHLGANCGYTPKRPKLDGSAGFSGEGSALNGLGSVVLR